MGEEELEAAGMHKSFQKFAIKENKSAVPWLVSVLLFVCSKMGEVTVCSGAAVGPQSRQAGYRWPGHRLMFEGEGEMMLWKGRWEEGARGTPIMAPGPLGSL